jgi:peptide/nickel transport system substrate-binding protein
LNSTYWSVNGGVNVWTSGGSLHLFNQRQITPGKATDLSDLLPWEKELDRLYDEGAQTFDFAERKRIYDQAQQIVYDEVPMIYLYSPLSIVAVQDRIQNFDPTPLETFHNLEEIWIKQK